MEDNKISEEPQVVAASEEVVAVEEKPVVNEAPKSDVVFNDKPKKNTGMILGMILLLILAIGGIGFGIWAWMDGNAQKEQLNSQISSLQQQNSELMDKIGTNDGGTIVDIDDNGYKNPEIVSTEENKSYSVYFISSELDGHRISINVSEGSISGCHINKTDNSSAGECNISGISDSIYKVVEFGSGHDNAYNNIGFIMQDGTVEYFPLSDILESSSLSSKGKVSVSGYVTDAIDGTVGISVSPDEGYGYGSSIFTLSDGTFVLFDESMLK